MKSLNKFNAIAELKIFTEQLLLLYLALGDSGIFSLWICRFNKNNQLIETKRFTAEQEEQMLEYIRSKGVNKDVFLKLYDSKIMPYFRTEEFLRRNPRIFRETLNNGINTLIMDGSTVTECAECVIC